jgi:hypothetical protein
MNDERMIDRRIAVGSVRHCQTDDARLCAHNSVTPTIRRCFNRQISNQSSITNGQSQNQSSIIDH